MLAMASGTTGGLGAAVQPARTANRARGSVFVLTALLLAAAAIGRADLELEQTGQVMSLPQPPESHWVWVGDPVLRRSALLDLDSGKLLGSVGAGEGIPGPLFPRTRPELYMPQTHYSRGDHGERTDVLVVYDATQLLPIDEVILPPKRAIFGFDSGAAALSDDERFAALFNLTPATSMSIVNVETRTLVQELPTPGCSLVYAAGPRRFASLCGNGALLLVTLDETGRVVDRTRSAPFFDPATDPVTEKAARWGDTWLFVSFEGYVHEVDLSAATPRFSAPWSLLSDAQREASWRIGGTKHLAVHQATGRLYSLVHQGGPDTHKDAGTELWVYDLVSRSRVQRIQLASSPGGIWPFRVIASWLRSSDPQAVDEVQVTQDAAPLLVTLETGPGGLGVYDALSGEFRRRIRTGNMANLGLVVPSGWAGALEGDRR
jgi:methylamine dehydrogenase heavy chain